jgi:uncharacterized protein YecA (UPF0149 family)
VVEGDEVLAPEAVQGLQQNGGGFQATPARNGARMIPASAAGGAAAAQIDPANPATWGKVQRNAPCPCGSGKKYKHCHGRFA